MPKRLLMRNMQSFRGPTKSTYLKKYQLFDFCIALDTFFYLLYLQEHYKNESYI